MIIKKYFKYFKNRFLFNRNTTSRIRSIHTSDNIKVGSFVSTGYNAYIGDNVSIGDCTYLNDGSWGVIVIEKGTTIGKYCSIGPNVYIGLGNHPQQFTTTHPILYEQYWQDLLGVKDFINIPTPSKPGENQNISIGNDVWIGGNVTIKDQVTIGDGSIIAGGSVVTKNVPPYSIVGGVPAKIIRYRFSEEIIDQLIKIDRKWWDWDQDELRRNINILYSIDEYIEYSKKTKKS